MKGESQLVNRDPFFSYKIFAYLQIRFVIFRFTFRPEKVRFLFYEFIPHR